MQHFKFENWRTGGLEDSIFNVTNFWAVEGSEVNFCFLIEGVELADRAGISKQFETLRFCLAFEKRAAGARCAMIKIRKN